MEQVSAKANWNSQNARNATPVRFIGRRSALQEEPVHTDETVAVAEHEGEAPGVEEKTAEAGVDDAFHQHVYGFARAAEARFEHRESDLHAEHQECRDQRPHRVDRVDDVIAL